MNIYSCNAIWNGNIHPTYILLLIYFGRMEVKLNDQKQLGEGQMKEKETN
jgi:hypothetical protein